MNLLLSLYDQWRKKFFPIGSFEDFVQRIEKMGPNKECQVQAPAICPGHSLV